MADTDDPTAAVRRMFAAFGAGDLDALIETVRPDSRGTHFGADPRPTKAGLVGGARVGGSFGAIPERLEVTAFNTAEFVVRGEAVVVFGSESGRSAPRAHRSEGDFMIKVRPAGERGKTRTDWLDSSHTFSFNRYYDPRYTGFRDLLVINEDFVAPGRGFGAHSHADMEILSYVVSGALEHRDSAGGSGVIRPNELQRMTAGTGVTHSEFNASETEPVHFLQIWLLPEREGLQPGYEQRAFPDEGRRGRLRLIASREGSDGSLSIHQDVKVFDALLAGGDEVSYRLGGGRHAWVQVIRGAVSVNGTKLGAGDGAAASEEAALKIGAAEGAEIMLFDLA